MSHTVNTCDHFYFEMYLCIYDILYVTYSMNKTCMYQFYPDQVESGHYAKSTVAQNLQDRKWLFYKQAVFHVRPILGTGPIYLRSYFLVWKVPKSNSQS